MWNVWFTTSRHLSQQAPTITTGPTRLLRSTTHARAVEAGLETRMVQSVR
jgi:hypothetical protein